MCVLVGLRMSLEGSSQSRFSHVWSPGGLGPAGMMRGRGQRRWWWVSATCTGQLDNWTVGAEVDLLYTLEMGSCQVRTGSSCCYDLHLSVCWAVKPSMRVSSLYLRVRLLVCGGGC